MVVILLVVAEELPDLLELVDLAVLVVAVLDRLHPPHSLQ